MGILRTSPISSGEKKGLFDYVRPSVPKGYKFIISPSSIGKFFEHPKSWYKEDLMGGEREFKGNTSTVLGTICHYIYESYNKCIEVDPDDIKIQLGKYALEHPELDINTKEILDEYHDITEAVFKTYLYSRQEIEKDARSEVPVVAEVMPGIYVAGTTDRIENDVIVDFKTVKTKPNELAIPFNYKVQLLAYAYALRKLGKEINWIRIVYGVRPTKKLPARCFVVSEAITPEAEKMIEDTLYLIGESVMAVKDNVKLAYLIFKSYDLKEE